MPDRDLFRTYDVSIEFINGIAGGTPLNPDLIRQHIRLFSEGVSNPLKYAKEVEGEVSLVGVGRKGTQFFAKRGYTVDHQVTLPTAGPQLENAVDLRRPLDTGANYHVG
ncbi:MAG: hypothetical protein IIC73_07720 [Armatimonadetes bacterium]|nr:hypothetical protein [Armatimonadota bacterium]